MKSRKPLEQWQKDDAARLQRAWHAFAKANNWSQMDLAHACDWKTQGAVNQYLLGKIPLNWPALMKFCRALGVNPRDISPTLANEYGSYSGAAQQATQMAARDVVITAPTGKTLVVPPELLDTVEDLIKAWATSTVTKRQLHAYRTMFRADANIEPPPALPKEKPSPITTKISQLKDLIQPDDDTSSSH